MHSGNRLFLILATTVAFALAARLAHGVNTSGAMVGAAVAFVFVLARQDFRLLWVLLVVFFVTLAATRAGGLRKQQLKVAEAQRGRSASQVMANLGVAAGLLAIPSVDSTHLLALTALAELAADTTSSEIGAAFSARTVLITSWQKVSPGTDGGISLNGTAAGILAALMTAACAAALGLIGWLGMLIVAGAGATGMLVDSGLGATLERRGYLNNDVVNLLSTAAAAGLAFGCGLLASSS
ncbi:MAG TPA: DUF92 domain-containing protein [Candidatus Angelobacter sp.]